MVFFLRVPEDSEQCESLIPMHGVSQEDGASQLYSRFVCQWALVLNKVLILLKCLFIFIFGCAGSSLLRWLFFSCEWGLLGCHMQDSHHSGFSCCRTQALEHTAFSSCSIWAPQLQHLSSRAVSIVVAHRLSCSTACGIFPDQESNSCPLH